MAAEDLAFILPGYPASVEEEKYRDIASIYSEQGFEVRPLDIEWSRDFWDNLEWVEKEISRELEDRESPEIHFFGHSWGAAILLTLSPEYEPKSQVLAGLSPEFSEDVETFSTLQQNISTGMQKLAGIYYDIPLSPEEKPSLRDIREQTDGDIYLIYGEREYSGFFGIKYLGMEGELTRQRKQLLDAQEIVVPNSTHMMDSSQYISAIEEIIFSLG